MAVNEQGDTIIEVRGVTVGFGNRIVLDAVDLDVRRGEILGFVGGSGAGKSVLLRTIVGLLPRSAGDVKVLGVDMGRASDEDRQTVERRWGVLFQQGPCWKTCNSPCAKT